MKYLFVDSDAFVALAKKDDNNHKLAIKQFEGIIKKPWCFITSNYVFSEVVTVLSQRVGKKAALEFIEKIKGENGIEIVWIDEDLESSAIEIFKKQASKNVSFVDCTNMAIIKSKSNIEAVFSFDNVYKRNHIKRISEIN